MSDEQTQSIEWVEPKYKATFDELVEAVRQHRMARYGVPPKGPFYSADTTLYKKAGISGSRSAPFKQGRQW